MRTARFGLDVKWGVTQGLSLDLTLNTDFAETEVDEQQVNLTRFSLFFPEKREFFLENAGIFEFGLDPGRGRPLLQTFFSRRIGIGGDGQPVPIDWGARLTGRVGDWNLGVLDVQTAAFEPEPGDDLEPVERNNWGAVRLKRNVGRRSSVGMIATNRQGTDTSNRVVGADVDWKFTDKLSAAGFYATSDDTFAGTDEAFGAGANFDGAILDWNASAVEIGERFEPGMGFLLRQGVRQYEAGVEWEPRPDSELIRDYGVEFDTLVVTTLDGTVETRELRLDPFGIQLESEDRFTFFVNHNFERLFESFEIVDEVVIPVGEYTFTEYGPPLRHQRQPPGLGARPPADRRVLRRRPRFLLPYPGIAAQSIHPFRDTLGEKRGHAACRGIRHDADSPAPRRRLEPESPRRHLHPVQRPGRERQPQSAHQLDLQARRRRLRGLQRELGRSGTRQPVGSRSPGGGQVHVSLPALKRPTWTTWTVEAATVAGRFTCGYYAWLSTRSACPAKEIPMGAGRRPHDMRQHDPASRRSADAVGIIRDERPWLEANRRHLLAAVDVVRAALEHFATQAGGSELPDRRAEAAAALGVAAADLLAPSALDRFCTLFGLSSFERDVLLLGVGMELDAHFATLCAAVHGDAQRAYPSFRLALDALPDAHWSALSPDGCLRRWRMIEIGPGDALAASPLRLAERVLHELLGVRYLDERLAGLVEPVTVPEELTPGHEALAERIAGLWYEARTAADLAAVQLVGGEASERRAIAAVACRLLGRDLLALPAVGLPTQHVELEGLRRVWQLEGALSGCFLLLDCVGLDHAADPRFDAVDWLTEHTLGGVVVSCAERRLGRERPQMTLEVAPPSAAEQRGLWRAVLAEHLVDDDALVGRLATQFHLSAPAIRAAGFAAMSRSRPPGEELAESVWGACRLQARHRLEALAQRIVPSASWNELVVPAYQRKVLRQVAVHVRQRQQVYEHWGFGNQDGRGLGVSALFAGPSGTGKTMAAEVLAAELSLDLFRIDLSAVVSKYIGETEKNLRKIFDAAEAGGAILLFDEADALFGKRSEVKDSHDRHANIEVSYLLQRMESYRGLAVLTTNIKKALDTAFLRRLRFIVEFPFPDADQRAEIWRRVFPPQTPTEGLDPERLARLDVTGGVIRNIALHAAFLAADAEEPVRMTHLLRAARGECAKLERSLTPGEVAGWI